MTQIKKPLIVYLPDTRGVEIGQYGIGNLKLGLGIFTYSRRAGHPMNTPGGCCPGATPECESICYAKCVQQEAGVVAAVWQGNSYTSDVPPIPAEAKIVRAHIGGDFDTPEYIRAWVQRLRERPDVTFWAYTRSWRVPELLPVLEVLRALPNVQLFASMDSSTQEIPPAGWRRAWIDGDVRAGEPWMMRAHLDPLDVEHKRRNQKTFDGTMTLVCPEETHHKKNCLECGYCFEGKRNDVTFLRH